MRELFVTILLGLLVTGASGESVFLEEPSPAIVAENEVAEFRCRVSSGRAQGWAVNGTFTSSQHNPDIEENSEPASDGGNRIEILTIVPRIDYNGTTVQCFAFPDNINSSTTLLIQGPLAAVTDLTAVPAAGADSILFSWVAPFSHNLTNTEPDITYRVDVYNSADNGAEPMVTEHGLTETSYSFTANETLPCDLFTGVVTPVNGAGNGRASEPVNGTSFSAPIVREAVVSKAIYMNGTVTTVLISIDFKRTVYVCTFNVMIITNDGRDPEIGRGVDLKENTGLQTFIIPFNDTVPNRIWSMDIVVKNLAGSTTIGQIPLSTYDVQDIIPVSGSPRGIEFNVTFATNSRALGCVVIMKSGSMEAVLRVLVKYRNIDSTSDQFTVTGLPPESYDMAAFDLEDSSGLPGRYRAVNARLESRETDSQPLEVEGGVIAEAVLITPTDGAVCVDCTIPDRNNATECVFITHPSESLEKIETVVLMNGEKYCIPDPSSQQYSVASFGRLESRIVLLSNVPSEAGPGTPSLVGTVIGVLAPAIVVVSTLAVLVLLLRRVKGERDVTLPDTEKLTVPNKDTQPAAPLLVQAPSEEPPPPPESENRITDDGGSPFPSVNLVDLPLQPTKQEPLYDAVDATLPDTNEPTVPNEDTQPAAPFLVQAPSEEPPPPPESCPHHCTSDNESNPACAAITSTPFSNTQGSVQDIKSCIHNKRNAAGGPLTPPPTPHHCKYDDENIQEYATIAGPPLPITNTQESVHDINSNNVRSINYAGGPPPPPPPPESEKRITDDGGSPNPTVSSVDSLSEHTKQEPLYDTPDKNVPQKKSDTELVLVNTIPDTEVPYAGYKSDGKLGGVIEHIALDMEPTKSDIYKDRPLSDVMQ